MEDASDDKIVSLSTIRERRATKLEQDKFHDAVDATMFTISDVEGSVLAMGITIWRNPHSGEIFDIRLVSLDSEQDTAINLSSIFYAKDEPDKPKLLRLSAGLLDLAVQLSQLHARQTDPYFMG